ncbi:MULTISPECIES: ATP-binding protein [unclassified Acidovorax]|uniref:hybrid sensor histidine kinase/response regulator n=1 Tax=unclassified Acidovorax TaxID=2684926 RepID=UPI003D015D0D
MVMTVAGQPLRLLHLEDSLADHVLAKLTLQRAKLHCNVQQVDTLQDFCDLTSNQPFDLILADYRLQGFTALDAWEHVAKLATPVPFVLLSGAIGEAAAVDAMRLGFSDYLLKDDISRLPHVVTRAIEVHQARQDRELAVTELAASQQRLAELTEHLQTSIEQERASIAREIHDDIGGSLTAVRVDLAWIGRHAQDPGTQDHLASASDMLQHAIGASQRIMMNLRPPILEQGLVAAIQWLAAGFERRSAVRTQVVASGEAIDVPSDIQLVAYRTAQEALTNIAKYAQAGKVHIDLSDHEGVLTVEIADDGCGFDVARLADKPKAFGIKGLHERARTVGGWLDVSTQPGKGTCLTLSIPLATSDQPPITGDVW